MQCSIFISRCFSVRIRLRSLSQWHCIGWFWNRFWLLCAMRSAQVFNSIGTYFSRFRKWFQWNVTTFKNISDRKLFRVGADTGKNRLKVSANCPIEFLLWLVSWEIFHLRKSPKISFKIQIELISRNFNFRFFSPLLHFYAKQLTKSKNKMWIANVFYFKQTYLV